MERHPHDGDTYLALPIFFLDRNSKYEGVEVSTKCGHVFFHKIRGVAPSYDCHDLCEYPQTTVNTISLHGGDLKYQNGRMTKGDSDMNVLKSAARSTLQDRGVVLCTS